MLDSVLVRLVMVLLTMTVVCWIGWSVPASRETDTLRAVGLREADPSVVALQVNESQRTPESSAERRHGKSLRQAATVILDVNQATTQELERLPGIGPVLAGRIVEYRKTRGAFQDIEQLRHVKGIGHKTYERLRGLVAVPPGSKSARKAA